MQEITGKKCLTIDVEANEDYVISYPDKQYLDILNCTNGYIKISSEQIESDNYAVIPKGTAYNSWCVSGWKLYIHSDSTGKISFISR